MNKILQSVRQILLAIWSEQHKAWTRDPIVSDVAQGIYEKHFQGRVLTKEQLDALIAHSPSGPDDEFMNLSSRRMCLPPLEKNSEFVPVLYLPSNFQEWLDSVRLQVGLYTDITEAGGSPSNVSIGFRVEGPHHNNNDSGLLGAGGATPLVAET